MLATLTNAPLFIITEAEAKMMADALEDVSKHYDIGGFNGPRMSLINLAAACGMIYLPRIMAARAMRARPIPPAAAPSSPDDAGFYEPPPGGYDLSGLN